MIHVTPHMRLLVATAPADFRKGIDGLARICRIELASDPFNGALFVFRNRRRTAIKILAYDGQGFWLCQKRLSTGKFRYWPSSADSNIQAMKPIELQLLLSGGDPGVAVTATPDWRRIHAVDLK